MPSLPFMEINRQALASGYLKQLFPSARRVGRELQCGDIHGGKGKSFCVNLDSGAWVDNSAGTRGGDVISLFAAREGLSQGEAARRLSRDTPPRKVAWKAPEKRREEPVLKPVSPPCGSSPDMKHSGREPVLVSCYLDPWQGWTTAFIIARYEPPGGSKYFIPYSYGDYEGVVGWHKKMRPGQRPLLGLFEMKQYYKAGGVPLPGLVVEGEKAHAAASRMMAGKAHVITWHGGAQAVDLSDWRMLDGLPAIYLWPDNDQPGREAMQKIARHLICYRENVVLLLTPPSDAPEGWDAADAEAEGRAIYDFD